MNKKVDEEFKFIHDEYLLQCICTEMKDKIIKLEDELKIITKDFEKIYCENQKLKQELDKLKENRI